MSTQMNVTIAMRANSDVKVSATFSLFVEDENDARESGATAAKLEGGCPHEWIGYSYEDVNDLIHVVYRCKRCNCERNRP